MSMFGNIRHRWASLPGAARASLLLVVGAVIGFSATKLADHRSADRPYAGLDTREIKALAPDRIKGLRAGEGLGYALPAELNDLPGPRHVLDLDLSLDTEQMERIEAIFAAMNAEARELGDALIEAERALDLELASGNASAERVDALTAEAAAIEAQLRATHLNAHLATTPLLTDGQRQAYAAARGYAGGHGSHGGH